jgi:phosphocarrier protein FPr
MATQALVRQMTGDALALRIAAGCGADGAALGTDAAEILAGLEALRDCEAIVVLMDIGSAVLSAEMARDLADDALRAKTHLSSAPFVEGTVAGGVAAAAGLPLARVLAEAAGGLAQKQSGLVEAAPSPAPPPAQITLDCVVADPHGLHLRPAAAFVKQAAGFDAVITLRAGARTARGDSLTAIMALGVAGGGSVTLAASGPDAQAAVAALRARLAQAPNAEPAPAPATASSGPQPLSPGRTAARLFVAARSMPLIPETPATDRAATARRLDAALDRVRARLAGSAILEAQAALLGDPAIRDAAHRHIAEHRQNECAAWQCAIEAAAATYAALEAPYLRDRARDVREAGDAVLCELLGHAAGIDWPAGEIIALVEDLTAAEAAALPANVLGILDRKGGANSHATILLRAAGIPALGQVSLPYIPEHIGFDGATGEITLAPDAATLARWRGAGAITHGPATLRLPDGSDLEFWANVSGERDSAAAAQAGAFGIGLARTEMLFLDRADAPGEAEQAARIAAMLRPFQSRPVVVRVLDAGADKPVPFLHLASEQNPALGVRGIRALLQRPDFFKAHLRAILRAGDGHDLRIMIPMVATAAEMQAARHLLAACCEETGMRMPTLGAMIEVPAAALRIQDLNEMSDFFSIGTNDLTQYVFAAERGHAGLGVLGDAGHPAMLDLCAAMLARTSRPVSVCGEAAGDPAIAPLWVAAGIRRLSMGAARLPAIRQIFAA